VHAEQVRRDELRAVVDEFVTLDVGAMPPELVAEMDRRRAQLAVVLATPVLAG
jgi:hypothetical protein